MACPYQKPDVHAIVCLTRKINHGFRSCNLSCAHATHKQSLQSSLTLCTLSFLPITNERHQSSVFSISLNFSEHSLIHVLEIFTDLMTFHCPRVFPLTSHSHCGKEPEK